MKRILNKNILTSFWRPLRKVVGVSPPTMEGASMVFHNNNLYVYGGFCTNLYNEMRTFDIHKKKWSIVKLENEFLEIPTARYGHSMVKYKDFLFTFGGAGKN